MLIFLNFAHYYLIMKNTIYIDGGVTRRDDVRFAEPVSFILPKKEHLAVVGPNGGGKSVLVDIIMGRYPLREGVIEYDFSSAESNAVYRNVKYISFRDVYGAGNTAGYYYQQRWNMHDQDGIPCVRELLGDEGTREWRNELIELLGLRPLLDKLIIMLSSGELRKFQIALALFSSPSLLIIDNPFIGLDASMRSLLNDILERIVSSGKVQILLVMSDADTVPSFIDRVVHVADMKVYPAKRREEYIAACNYNKKEESFLASLCEQVGALPDNESRLCNTFVELNNVTIKYGERTILKDLSWMVKSGEVWALTGENGSGKSTLLSLLCADNLQSYACDITLFGRRRGSGETIWEIKKNIGYVSPEMHRAYMKNIPAIDIVASGLHDSVGLYVRSTPEQIRMCEWWMNLFGVLHLKERSFMQLSSGEQRLLLLVRAFVKDPALLILDEPLHGLDAHNKQKAKSIIDTFSRRRGKSVIYVSHYEDELPSTVTNRLHLYKV